jgi:hypothetical protein
MENELWGDVVEVLIFLLPGFLAAWVFYGLTSHPKPGQFERVVQALIFTFIIRVLLTPIEAMATYLGRAAPIAEWNELAGSMLLALALGASLAYLTNTDRVHKKLRAWGFTTRTSHPSEWFCVFSEKVAFVVLHLKDGRRLYGWPKEWPIQPDRGEFYIMLASWVLEDGSQVDLTDVDGMLIPAKDVKWVEFIRPLEQIS